MLADPSPSLPPKLANLRHKYILESRIFKPFFSLYRHFPNLIPSTLGKRTWEGLTAPPRGLKNFLPVRPAQHQVSGRLPP